MGCQDLCHCFFLTVNALLLLAGFIVLVLAIIASTQKPNETSSSLSWMPTAMTSDLTKDYVSAFNTWMIVAGCWAICYSLLACAASNCASCPLFAIYLIPMLCFGIAQIAMGILMVMATKISDLPMVVRSLILPLTVILLIIACMGRAQKFSCDRST